MVLPIWYPKQETVTYASMLKQCTHTMEKLYVHFFILCYYASYNSLKPALKVVSCWATVLVYEHLFTMSVRWESKPRRAHQGQPWKVCVSVNGAPRSAKIPEFCGLFLGYHSKATRLVSWESYWALFCHIFLFVFLPLWSWPIGPLVTNGWVSHERTEVGIAIHQRTIRLTDNIHTHTVPCKRFRHPIFLVQTLL